ncbi:MAG: DUF3017 domain-containing protein [Propionibacteriales bacterium]|nr:DUF3017 domain-containing protein [Propionibacteriales bacterium]
MTTPTADPRPPKNWLQQILGQWPLAGVLTGVFVGLVIAVPFGHWRIGCTLIGAAATVGGLLRLMPQQRVGLLAVRSRLIDTILLLGTGVGILVLAWVIPPNR